MAENFDRREYGRTKAVNDSVYIQSAIEKMPNCGLIKLSEKNLIWIYVQSKTCCSQIWHQFHVINSSFQYNIFKINTSFLILHTSNWWINFRLFTSNGFQLTHSLLIKLLKNYQMLIICIFVWFYNIGSTLNLSWCANDKLP